MLNCETSPSSAVLVTQIWEITSGDSGALYSDTHRRLIYIWDEYGKGSLKHRQ